MKNFINYTIAAFIAILTISCEDLSTPNLGDNEQWIQFEFATSTVSESAAEPLAVPVLYASGTNDSELSVNFTYTASSTEGYEITPSNGVVTIPAGEFVGYIYVTPIDDDVTNDDITIDFTLSSNDIPLGLAGEGIYNTTSQVTIVEDDCPLVLSEFVGTYSADEEGYDVIYEVSVTYDESNPNVLTFSNLWDVGGTTTLTLDNSDPANPIIYFQDGEYLYNNPDYGAAATYNPSALGDVDRSTFRTCSKYMDLYFRVCVSAGCFAEAHIELNKN